MKTPHAEITARILAELKAGAAPWVKPWTERKGAAPVTIPHNAASGRAYTGANVFLLWMIGGTFGLPRFLTFKQALDAGGNVRKGEHGFPVYFVGEVARPEGDDDAKPLRFLRRYTVFNVAQCENLDPAKLADAGQVIDPAFGGDIGAFYNGVGARTVHGGNMAAYATGPDLIQMPAPDQFTTEDSYHATRLHELTHWTGHKSRLDRLFPARFGDKTYAAEELVAELGAALLCAELGIRGELRHAGYIAHWIKLLEDHETAFVTAAAKAQRAVDYLKAKMAEEKQGMAAAA